MKRVKSGNDDLAVLLDALTVRRRSTSAERKKARLKGARAYKRKLKAKAAAARLARKARRAGSEEGRARVMAANKMLATGEPGRWLSVLRLMEEGKAYTRRELEVASGLGFAKMGLTLSRDLARRGLVERTPRSFVAWGGVTGATAKGFEYVVTALGLRVAAEGVAALPFPPNKKGRKWRPSETSLKAEA